VLHLKVTFYVLLQRQVRKGGAQLPHPPPGLTLCMMLGFAVEGKIFIFCAGLGNTTKLNPSSISQLGHTKAKVTSICLVKSTNRLSA
jgi:hypothetical protein